MSNISLSRDQSSGPLLHGVSVEHFGPGKLPDQWVAGDYLLVSAGVWKDGKRGPVPWVSRLIQFGQGLRFRGQDRPFAHWNHAVWVSDGRLIEALAHGITASPYEKYKDVEFHLVHSNLNAVERQDADPFVCYELNKHVKYGFLTIVSIALSLLTGAKLNFGIPNTAICSGLVAAALARRSGEKTPLT